HPLNIPLVQAQILELILPLLLIAIALAGYFSYNKRLKRVKQTEGLENKLILYRRALLFNYFLIESACFLALSFYAASGLHNFILYAWLVLIYLLYLRPHRMKIAMDLGIEKR